jgi:antitoxin component of MazEF toxin-antitoxin module
MYLDMERKLREISGSLVVTIPKQVCNLYGFKDGDMIEILHIGANELRLRKI